MLLLGFLVSNDLLTYSSTIETHSSFNLSHYFKLTLTILTTLHTLTLTVNTVNQQKTNTRFSDFEMHMCMGK